MVRYAATTWARGPRSKRSWSSISFRFVATVTILDPLGAPDVNPDEAAAQPCQVPGTLVPVALLGPACGGQAELTLCDRPDPRILQSHMRDRAPGRTLRACKRTAACLRLLSLRRCPEGNQLAREGEADRRHFVSARRSSSRHQARGCASGTS